MKAGQSKNESMQRNGIDVKTGLNRAITDRCAEFLQETVRQFFLFGVIHDDRFPDHVTGDAFDGTQLALLQIVGGDKLIIPFC